ncbi:hypothetical protein HO173_004470 [Letharia columbiana]|uniref:Uncharacterized protein n=1 Tax=Letharia columbiana TaxID=112416 RepID=A0A8H6FZJ2_9LECA|nr:uncharacterized protein HO173_004470 [Letharia columbiana]KAF6237580.1 hypothetical protein HO173_004470 [Letharia columbiana]
MSIPEPLNPNIPNARRLARKFTPHTPFHHPHLDPNVPQENLHLVPAALFPGRNLNWELPRPAVTNLHVMLKFTNEPDKAQKEFHDKIPQINDVLGLWSELKGASPTTTGEAQLRAQISVAEDQGWTSTEEGEGTTFHLVSNLDTPGRADVIYLTDAVEDSGEHAEDLSVPFNLRTMEWLGFDGSYVHLEDSKPKMAAFPIGQGSDSDEQSMRNSTPSNLRVTEWLEDEQYTDLPTEAYSSEPGSDAGKTSRETGTYENFWIKHDPSGPELALNTDEGESNGNTSL